jgi:WD40 repeat protein
MHWFHGRHISNTTLAAVRFLATASALATMACSDTPRNADTSAPRPPAAIRSLLSSAHRYPAEQKSAGYIVQPRDAFDVPGTEPPPSSWKRPSRFQGLRLPTAGNAPILVRASAGPWIPVRRLDARAVGARLEAGVVYFDQVQENVDARVFGTQHGVEDLWTVRAPVRELGYELDLPQGWSLRAASSLPLVEIRDASDTSQLRVWAKGAWDADGAAVEPRLEVDDDRILVRLPDSARWPVVVDPEWTGADTLVLAREAATLTQLPSSEVLIAGGDGPSTGLCERFDPARGTFTLDGKLDNPRKGHQAIVLPGGKVLMLGGSDDSGAPVRRAEVYDPATRTFAETNAPLVSPYGSAAVPLGEGKVLLAGGWNGAATRMLQVYDQGNNTFEKVGDMLERRWYATATLLPDNRVLVVGGRRNKTDSLSTTELCDPASGQCVVGPALQTPRTWHTATLLPSGQVMIAGGVEDGSDSSNVELIDPATSEVSVVPSPAPRNHHNAVLLPDGTVMLIGGHLANGDMPEATDVFDPVRRTWRQDSQTLHARFLGTTTLLFDGRLLTVGGVASPQTAELRSTAAFAESPRPLGLARSEHAAITLENGDVLLLGARDHAVADRFSATSSSFTYAGTLRTARVQLDAVRLDSGLVFAVGGEGSATNTAELFDPETGTSSSVLQLAVGRRELRVTKLPSGRVLITGGSETTTQAELFDPATGSMSATGYMSAVRFAHTATVLPDGRVLVAGGSGEQHSSTTAELYDPATGVFAPTGNMHATHVHHQAVLLPNGQVLIAGGSPTVEAYDADMGTFQVIGSLSAAREMSGLTLLPSGKVLLTGGIPVTDADTAELFDPATGQSTPVGKLTQHRIGHTSTLLPNGRVLVAGGFTEYDAAGANDKESGTAELYDPTSRSFSAVTSSETVRAGHTATLLPNGDVLLAGGQSSAEVDLWDRKDGQSVPTEPMSAAREHHAATLLRSGRVLITGGTNTDGPLFSGERYDWRQKRFERTADMLVARERHALTLLPSGRVLITGGSDDTTVEVYDPTANEMVAVGQLPSPRFAHAAVLLPSGDVLLAGGVDAGGQPVDTAEVWRVQRAESALIPTTTLQGGVMFGAMTTVGTALVSSERGTWAFDADGTSLTTQMATAGQPFAAIPQLFEGVLFCGTRFRDGGFAACATSNAQQAPTVPGLILAGADPDATATRLIDGNLLIRTNFGGQAASLTFRWVPPGAVRPSIEKAPGVIEIGEQVNVEGQRFTRPSAVGSDALGPSPLLAPGVVFEPASAGAPIPCPVTTWTDTRLSFEVPPTPYHGRGWLHVMVAGVPSIGWYVELQPRRDAASCMTDGECASGFCVEGICCDAPCEDGCRSCLASRNGVADGTCAAVMEGTDPRDACGFELCGATGECDGQGACSLVPEREPCGEDKLCVNQTCAATLGEDCASNRDCAAGQVCGVQGMCAAFVPDGAPADPGACSVSAAGEKRSFGPGGLLALLVLALGVRRKVRVPK